ncbi:MAG TPA: hypothetical protein VMS76_06850, partial [Planctomycetota bacterium]|nr:hypothetical protein [Planctomycetota bacterium]
IENSRFLVDHLTSLGLASRGPDLPMVMDSWIQPPEGDGRCHVGKTGRTVFGAALASWAGWGS